MANAGPVIIFVVLMVGTVILGLYVLMYVARCIQVMVTGTALGQEAIQWPDEMIVDWLVAAASLIGVVLVWLFPAGIVMNLVGQSWMPEHPLLRVLLICLGVSWLFFPIGALSSLSSASRWNVLSPLIVGQMFQLFPATVVFYILSGLVLFMGFGSLGLVIESKAPLFLIVAVPVAAAAVLIYGRLLGRLAMIRRRVPFLPDPPAPKRKKKAYQGPPIRSTPDPDSPYTGEADHVYSQETLNRSRIFDEDEDPMEAYGVSSHAPNPIPETPKSVRKRTRPLDPEEEDAQIPYGIDSSGKHYDSGKPTGFFVPRQGQFPAPKPPKEPAPGKKPGPIKLRKKKPVPVPPFSSLWNGVFFIHLSNSCIGSWFSLMLGIGAVSGMIIACQYLLPG